MVDRYILKSKEVMAVKLEDNETCLDQIINLLGSHFVGFVYKEKGTYCAIKWNEKDPPIYANAGDWLIKKNNGSFEVCGNDTFMKEYASLFTVAEVKKTDKPHTNWLTRLFKRIF